jgi:hypothetical protein
VSRMGILRRARRSRSKYRSRSDLGLSENERTFQALYLVILFVYILLEISFNARVASVAGSSNLDTDSLRSMELLGRSVSGLGAMLLLTGTFLTRTRGSGFFTRWLPAVAIAVIGFFAMFFGQKVLVDNLIDASSAELRHQTVRAQALRGAIAEGAVELQEGAQTLFNTDNADAKIFMTLFPAASTMNTPLKDQIDSQLEDISSVYEAILAARIFEYGYSKYDSTRDSLIDEAYPSYLEASNKYIEARDAAPGNAKKLARAVKPKLRAAWKSYKNFRIEAANKAAKSAAGSEVIEGYKKAIKMESRCPSASASDKSEREDCFSKIREALRDQLIKGDFKKDEIRSTSWWAEKLTFKDFFGSLNMDGVKLLLMQPGAFIKESGGYAPGIESYDAFYAHRATANLVRDGLEKEGVTRVDDWRTTTPKNIVPDLESYLKKSFKNAWQDGLSEMGVAKSMGPDLDFKEFVEAAGIEDKLRQKLRIRKGEAVSLRMNKRDFYREVAEPEAKRKAAEIAKVMLAPPVKFSDGETYELEGKRAVRTTYIPPIVMILSLTMVMISSLKIFTGIVAGKRIGKFGKAMVATFAFLVVLIAPFYLHSASNPIGEAMDLDGGYSDSVHPVFISAVRWLVHTQPLIFPLGEAVDSTLHVGDGFKKHIESYAAEIDARVNL